MNPSTTTNFASIKKTLPATARNVINRCNLPAEVLGDVSFQSHPKKICIDGVAELHKRFFHELDKENDVASRSHLFTHYMKAHFLLDALSDAGYDNTKTVDRSRANYLRILRGWFFDSDSQEGAVIKLWVESRFGLLPRYHKTPIRCSNDSSYTRYLTHASRGLYNTNALEAQLDLLYSFCQYELQRRFPEQKAITLYRGINHLHSLERLTNTIKSDQDDIQKLNSITVLLNNINSFSADATRAGEFGDVVIKADVPHSKLLFFSGLMPGIMTSENEYAVIGGVYEVNPLAEIFNQTLDS